MTNANPRAAVRRSLRVALPLSAVTLVMLAAPAQAAPPEGWEDTHNGSLLHAVLLLGGVPFLLFVLILLYVYLPSFVRGQRYEPALAWRDDPEWFGGPRKGVEAAPAEAADDQDRGGASAHW